MLRQNRRRAVGAAAAAALGLGLVATGCGDDRAADNEVPGEILNVYVSVPLEGERAPEGQAIVNGAKLALADAAGESGGWEVHASFLDDAAGQPPRWDPATVGDNARRAAQDTGAIAYIGEIDSGATRISVPITNQARILQVTPAASAVDLTKSGPGVPPEEPDRFYPSGVRTFGRVVPADDVQARAGAEWAKRLRARRILAVSDGSGFGQGLVADFESAARALGLEVRTVQARADGFGRELRRAAGRVDLVYLGGVADRSLVGGLLEGLPGARLLASDALLASSLARKLGPLASRLYVTSPLVPASGLPGAASFVRRYRREFGTPPSPAAAYGYEAMAVVLDSIGRAVNGRDRTQVTRAFMATRSRRSILGSYSIDPETGDTSLNRVAGYRIENGRPRLDRVLTVPGP